MRNFLLGAVSAVALMGGAVVLGLPGQQTVAAGSETYRQLDLFGTVFEIVRSDYVEPVKEGEMIEAAINGMLASLDPHSSYLNPRNYREMQAQTRGEFGGLGLEVTMENGLIKVVAPIDDTPASRAGLRAGDVVVEIDGQPVQGLTLQEAVEKMRGPANSSIRLNILRQGGDRPFEVSLTRAVIKVQSVRSNREGDIGYVRITTFNEQTETGLKRAVEKLRQDIGPGMRGLVLDLRNNPGGLLDQAIAVSDAFLDKGEVVSTRGKRSEDAQRYNAKKGDILDDKALIVLINDGSASASEIVAGALQDHGRAKILGTRSFGKGSVQTIRPLGPKGSEGALRLTTARYYTPSGRSIQAMGIDPDYLVQPVRPPGTGDSSSLPQRRAEADLRHRLEPDQSRSPGAGTQFQQIRLPGGEQSTDPANDKTDYQLQRALDLLRGVAFATSK